MGRGWDQLHHFSIARSSIHWVVVEIPVELHFLGVSVGEEKPPVCLISINSNRRDYYGDQLPPLFMLLITYKRWKRGRKYFIYHREIFLDLITTSQSIR